MATAFAPRTGVQHAAQSTPSKKGASLNISFQPALPAALRRSVAAPRASRASRTVPLAFRGQGHHHWGGQSFNRRGAFGPFAWQLGGPLTQATLEDLAREFGFVMSSDCNSRGRSQQKQKFNSWADVVNSSSLAVDVEEEDGQYVVVADVPGLQKSDLKITVDKEARTLTISGERQRPKSEASDSSDNKKRRRMERRMGKFERVLSALPEDADLAAVTARVDKGVLQITVRKLPEIQQPDTTINIDID